MQMASFQKSAKATVPLTSIRALLSEAKRNFTDDGTPSIVVLNERSQSLHFHSTLGS